MKKSERYSLALTAQLAGEKKMPGFLELPGKNKQDFIRESTSHWVLMWNWRLLSEGSYVNRYSAVTIQPQNMWFL